MTEQEKQAFVNAVKGKKIRWSSWDTEPYFIPNGDRDGGYFGGMYYNGEIGRKISYNIQNGFNSFLGNEWEFVEDLDLLKKQWETALKSSKSSFKSPIIYTDENLKQPEHEKIEFVSDGQEWHQVYDRLDNQCKCDLRDLMMLGCQCGGF